MGHLLYRVATRLQPFSLPNVISMRSSAPAFPEAIDGLEQTLFARRVTPAQSIAIEEGHSAEDATIIDARTAVARWKERLEPRRPRTAQPERTILQEGLLTPSESGQTIVINRS